MSREITKSEAISNLNQIYGIVSPDIQRSLDLAIKALEEKPQGEILVEHCIEFNNLSSDCRSCHSKCTWFKCSKCGSAVDKDDMFCKHCGAELRGEER